MHTHREASKVVKDVDLSYLTLTALTLEEMKRRRRRGEKREKKRDEDARRRRRNN